MIIEYFYSQGNRIKNSYPVSALFSAASKSAGTIDSSTRNPTLTLEASRASSLRLWLASWPRTYGLGMAFNVTAAAFLF